jgi:hypothetical protein
MQGVRTSEMLAVKAFPARSNTIFRRDSLAAYRPANVAFALPHRGPPACVSGRACQPYFDMGPLCYRALLSSGLGTGPGPAKLGGTPAQCWCP